MLFMGFNFNDCSPEHSKPKQTQFYFETNCIVYLFEQFLPKINFEDISGVQFDCFPNAEYTCEPIIMDGVLPVTIPYRVSDFYSLSDIDKKKKTLELMMAGLRVVIKEKGWDETPFLYAYEKVIEQHYIFKKIYKKPKSSPNRKLKAKIEIEIGLYDCTASLIVEDKNQKKICTKLLYKEKPRFDLLYPFLGDVKWVSNQEIRVYARKPNEINFKFVQLA